MATQLYSARAAGVVLGVAPSTIYKLIRAGELKADVLIGSHLRIRDEELQRFIDSRRIA